MTFNETLLLIWFYRFVEQTVEYIITRKRK